MADKWIGVFDDLQSRYEKIEGDMEDERGLALKLTGCCIVAVTAIRDQDGFALDMAQSAANGKAAEIVDARENDTYREDESSFTDNVVRLYDFVYGQIRENRQISK